MFLLLDGAKNDFEVDYIMTVTASISLYSPNGSTAGYVGDYGTEFSMEG